MLKFVHGYSLHCRANHFLPKFLFFGVEPFDWCQQGSLIYGEGLDLLVLSFYSADIVFLSYKTSCLNEEVNRTEPFFTEIFPFFFFFGVEHFNWRQQGNLFEGKGSLQLTSLY